MKTITLPSNTKFVSFNEDVGRLLAIAEFPSESHSPEDERLLVARMQYDYRIGSVLLEAVRSGRLRVRDCITRFPLKPDAPSLDVLSSLVAIDDLRDFVSELGYGLQVGNVPERAIAENDPLKVKRSALVNLHKKKWPTIERDLSDASQNGLAKYARVGARGWNEKRALDWARANGKLINEKAPNGSLKNAIDEMSRLCRNRDS